MTAKTFADLTTQATTTLADNATRQISAADVRQMVIDILDSINESTLGLVDWTVDTVGNKDLIPKIDAQGIGSSDASPAFVAIGGVGTDQLEGLIGRRATVDGGGIVLVGFTGDPSGGITANAPVAIAGSSVIVDGTQFLVVPSAVLEDHFLISKPSIVLPDGRIVVPVVLGPTFTPTTTESATDSRNVDISPNLTEVDIISPTTPGGALTLANAYAAGSTISISMVIEETGNNDHVVTVHLKLDTGGGPFDVFTDVFNLRNNRINYFQSQPTTIALNIADILSLHVERSGSTGVDIRGDVAVSNLTIQST